jgi:Sigma-54 interaction domain
MGGPHIPSLHPHDHVHTPVHQPLGNEVELSAIRRSHPNVLLIGHKDSNERALSDLLSSCRTPVYERNPEFEMPIVGGGTFVLRGIELLSLPRQRILHEWFTRACGRIQVVSLASPQLFQLVSTGAFHEGLFYRLNVVMLMTTGR